MSRWLDGMLVAQAALEEMGRRTSLRNNRTVAEDSFEFCLRTEAMQRC